MICYGMWRGGWWIWLGKKVMDWNVLQHDFTLCNVMEGDESDRYGK